LVTVSQFTSAQNNESIGVKKIYSHFKKIYM